MSIFEYENRPNSLAFHDYTRFIKPPPNLRSLLGQGLKFIINPIYTSNWKRMESAAKIERRLRLMFGQSELTGDDPWDKRYYRPTGWVPHDSHWPEDLMKPRLSAFAKSMASRFKPKRRNFTNIFPFQQRALDHLQSQHQVLVVPCDKNLGPALIERDRYIQMMMRDHLHSTDVYHRLYPMQAHMYMAELRHKLAKFTSKHHEAIGKTNVRCLNAYTAECTDGYGTLYGMIKAHKDLPEDGIPKSRPVCNYRTSLIYAHACLLDYWLQPVYKARSSFVKNSFELKQQLSALNLPRHGVRIFTADAESMYTNIPTKRAIENLHAYLEANQHLFPGLPLQACKDLITLVFRNNFFRFDDMLFKQKRGTAMGTPPAVAFAQNFFADYEEPIVTHFRNLGHLPYYRRYVDDMFGVWINHPDPHVNEYLWNVFKKRMDTASNLHWVFSNLSTSIEYLDVLISLQDGQFHFTLHEKELNLHLYIPSYSAHPPGLLPGMVYGNLFRIHNLCSDPKDQQDRTRDFYNRLIRRGWKRDQLLPLFHKAIPKAKAYTGPSGDNAFDPGMVIFHSKFHPDDPPSGWIQSEWNRLVANPPGDIPLQDIQNPYNGHRSGYTRMVVAYKRHLNLGNLLSHKDLTKHPGPGASTFYNV